MGSGGTGVLAGAAPRRAVAGPTGGDGAQRATRSTDAWLLLVLTAGAAGLRLAVASSGGFWRDEAQTLLVTGLPSWSAVLDFLRLHESHPPLFYALVRVWTGLVGTGDQPALLLPVLLGAAAVPVAYLAGARMLTRPVGVGAAALVALSPSLALRSALLRPYSLLPLLALLSIYFLWRAVTGPGDRRGAWTGFAAASLALVYVHNWGWLVWGAEASVFGLWVLSLRGRAAAPGRQWAVAQAAILAGYAPWVPSLLGQLGRGFGPLRTDALSLGLQSLLTFFRAVVARDLGPWSVPKVLYAAAALAWLVAAAVGSARNAQGKTGEDMETAGRRLASMLVLGVPLLAYSAAVVLSPLSNLLFDQVLATTAPLVLVSLAWLVLTLWGSGRRTAAVGVGAVIGLAYGGAWGITTFPRSNARELARAVARQATPEDVIVFIPESIGSSFNRYFEGRNERISYPFVGRLGPVPYDERPRRMADPAAFAAVSARLGAVRAAGRSVWFIVNRPFLKDEPRDSASLAWSVPLRTRELAARLRRLYGPPVLRLPSDTEDGALESLGAELFVAGGGGDSR